MAITLISTVTVGAGGAASIDFTSIPGTYTDLMVVLSSRVTSNPGGPTDSAFCKFNSSSTSYTNRQLYGNGSSAGSNSPYTTAIYVGETATNLTTASTFSNQTFYIPNYSGATNKSVSTDSVMENNASGASENIIAGLWSNTAAITSISLTATSNWVQYSSASLYGITKGSSGGVTVA